MEPLHFVVSRSTSVCDDLNGFGKVAFHFVGSVIDQIIDKLLQTEERGQNGLGVDEHLVGLTMSNDMII